MKIDKSHEIIKEGLNKYENLVLLSSWGKDSIVVLNLVRQHKQDIPIWWVIPPFLPDETHEFAEEITEKWDLNLIKIQSDLIDDEDFMKNVVYEPNLPKSSPKQCCQYFKVEPLMKQVKKDKPDAWFSGLRSTESEKRSHYTYFWKHGPKAVDLIHPILEWTEDEIWKYIREENLPSHPWYEDDYRSLGCEPCSSPGGDTERDGRWKDTMLQGGGCGIHCVPMSREES